MIFTSNTTEAINLTAKSLSRESEQGIEPVVLNTLLEHTSNEMDALLCAYNQKGQYGKKRIKLMAVSGASNVLGVSNNLEEISRIVHRYGVHLLVDAAQLIAHRRVEMERCGIDYLAFSAHKVYAPFGTGVLVGRRGLLSFSPSELEIIRSSGEENAGGIAALGKALVLLQRIGLNLIREEELTERGGIGVRKRMDEFTMAAAQRVYTRL